MKKLRGRLKYLVVLFFIIFVILYCTIFGERGILYLQKLKSDLNEIRASSERIKAENEKLKKEVKLLQSDERYIEKTARKELGLVNEDEVIYKRVE